MGLSHRGFCWVELLFNTILILYKPDRNHFRCISLVPGWQAMTDFRIAFLDFSISAWCYAFRTVVTLKCFSCWLSVHLTVLSLEFGFMEQAMQHFFSDSVWMVKNQHSHRYVRLHWTKLHGWLQWWHLYNYLLHSISPVGIVVGLYMASEYKTPK